MEGIKGALDRAHTETFEATEKVNKCARRGEGELPEFEIGDYVLYCMKERPGLSGKFNFQWIGPFQVKDTKNSYVYVIQNVVDGKLWDAHVTRLSFYSTSQMEVGVELKDLVSRLGIEYEISGTVGMDKDEEDNIWKLH